MTPKERFLNVLDGREVDRVPVVSVTQTGIVELMNMCGAKWPDAHRDANLMATLAVAGHKIAGLEAVRIPFWLTGEAATMGCKVDYHEGRNDFTPTVKAELNSLEDLRVPDPSEGIMGEMLKAVRLCRVMVGNDVPIIVGVTGPFTLAGAHKKFC
ncbi:MAG: uroporphyrinogen decarboxylase family protein [Candidatus Methanomethylicaceae archaeon]